MNIDDIDFSKIRTIPIQKDRYNEYKLPKEGWFVGVSSNNLKSYDYIASYLYEPRWIALDDRVICAGCTIKGASEESKSWRIFDFCLHSEAETIFLYECQNQETAELLSTLLNTIPSGSISSLNQDISYLEDRIEYLQGRIEPLQEKMKKLAELKKYAKFLIC